MRYALVVEEERRITAKSFRGCIHGETSIRVLTTLKSLHYTKDLIFGFLASHQILPAHTPQLASVPVSTGVYIDVETVRTAR